MYVHAYVHDCAHMCVCGHACIQVRSFMHASEVKFECVILIFIKNVGS